MSSLVRAVLGMAVVVAIGGGVADAGPSARDRATAKTHIQKATTAHEAGQFDTARSELEAAYALDPQPDLLYALGQVHVKLGKCDVAITYYDRYLATNPGPEPAQAAREATTSCKQQLAAQEAANQPTAAPASGSGMTAPNPVAPPAEDGHSFDVLGAGLVAAGVVSTVVAVVMYSSARGDLDDAESAPTYDESASLVDDAHGKRTYAVVFGVVGAAAIGVGTWHYLRHRKNEREHAGTGLTIAPTLRGGGIVTWGGSW